MRFLFAFFILFISSFGKVSLLAQPAIAPKSTTSSVDSSKKTTTDSSKIVSPKEKPANKSARTLRKEKEAAEKEAAKNAAAKSNAAKPDDSKNDAPKSFTPPPFFGGTPGKSKKEAKKFPDLVSKLSDLGLPDEMLDRIRKMNKAEMDSIGGEDYHENIQGENGEELMVIMLRFIDGRIIGWIKKSPITQPQQRVFLKTEIDIPLQWCGTDSLKQEHCVNSVEEMQELADLVKDRDWHQKTDPSEMAASKGFGDDLQLKLLDGKGKRKKKGQLDSAALAKRMETLDSLGASKSLDEPSGKKGKKGKKNRPQFDLSDTTTEGEGAKEGAIPTKPKNAPTKKSKKGKKGIPLDEESDTPPPVVPPVIPTGETNPAVPPVNEKTENAPPPKEDKKKKKKGKSNIPDEEKETPPTKDGGETKPPVPADTPSTPPSTEKTETPPPAKEDKKKKKKGKSNIPDEEKEEPAKEPSGGETKSPTPAEQPAAPPEKKEENKKSKKKVKLEPPSSTPVDSTKKE